MAENYTTEELNDLSFEELQDLVITNQEEYNRLKSSTSQGANLLIEEKKQLEEAIALSIKDESQLSVIAETNPILAEKLAQKLFGKSAEDLTKKEEKDISKMVEEELSKKEIEKTLSTVKSQLSEEEQKQFDEEYADLVEGRTLTTEKANKFIKIALKSVGVSLDHSKEEEARVIGLGNGSSNNKSMIKSSDQKRIEYARSLLN